MLSAYAAEQIKKLNRSTDNVRFSADTYLRAAGENAETPEDKAAFAVLSGALSMAYDTQEDCYTPMLVLNDGRRSFGMEDLDERGTAIIEEALPLFEPFWIRAQLADILWLKTGDHRYAQTAAFANLSLFEASYDPEDWVSCFQAARRAFQIARKLGRNNHLFSETLAKIDAVLRKADGTDPLFLSLNLIEMVAPYAGKEQLQHYLSLSQKLFTQAKAGGEASELVIQAAYRVYADLLHRTNKDNKVRALNLELAEHYEALADDLTGRPIHAELMLQKAYNLYDKKQDRERCLQLRGKLKHTQQERLKSMASIPFEFDAAPIRKNIETLFHGLSRQEAILAFGECAMLYKVEEVRQGVLTEQQKNVFSSLFSKRFIDEEGRLVKILSPLDLRDPQEDASLLREHMVHYVSDRRSLGETICLQLAYHKVRERGAVASDDLSFLIDRNALIPEERRAIIRTGLQLGLNGELYASLHILLPQTENLLRELVKLCGDMPTYLKEDGTEDIKPLSQLFDSQKLREAYDEDLLFTWKTLLDERGGPNLRNEIAHGVLSPKRGSGGAALCFLSLLIRFLALYSTDAHAVYEKLNARGSPR